MKEKITELVNSAVNSTKKEYFRIEERADMSPNEKVSRIIKVTASICAGVAMQPIPFADLAILTPIQILMGTRIAAIRGIKLSESDVKRTITEIGGVVGMGFLAQQGVIGLYKIGVPFLGGLMTIPLVWGLTFAMGRVMDLYLQEKAKGNQLSKKELESLWKKGKEEGKREQKKN